MSNSEVTMTMQKNNHAQISNHMRLSNFRKGNTINKNGININRPNIEPSKRKPFMKALSLSNIDKLEKKSG